MPVLSVEFDSLQSAITKILREMTRESFLAPDFRDQLAGIYEDLYANASYVDLALSNELASRAIHFQYAWFHSCILNIKTEYPGSRLKAENAIDDATDGRSRYYSGLACKRLGRRRRFLLSEMKPFSGTNPITKELGRLPDPRTVRRNNRCVNKYMKIVRRILTPLSIQLANMEGDFGERAYRYILSVAVGCAAERR